MLLLVLHELLLLDALPLVDLARAMLKHAPSIGSPLSREPGPNSSLLIWKTSRELTAIQVACCKVSPAILPGHHHRWVHQNQRRHQRASWCPTPAARY